MIYFTKEEFACPCCGENYFDMNVAEMLDRARKLANIPFKITSGFRCTDHNESVGGSPTSSHLNGTAVDIECLNSAYRMIMVEELLAAGFSRIGVANNFIHVDYDLNKTQDVLWTY